MRDVSIETPVHLRSMQRFEYCFDNPIRPDHHIDVPESQDAKAIRSNERVAAGIVVRLFDMLAAVQFDDDGSFEADEIANIRAKGALPPKLEVCEPATA